jgi:2-dehydropantoate 2-reductase
MAKKIAVLGAGAIGSSVGADLTHRGYDITIIDQWPAQVETLKSSGLRIEMTDENLQIPVRAHLCDLADGWNSTSYCSRSSRTTTAGWRGS